MESSLIATFLERMCLCSRKKELEFGSQVALLQYPHHFVLMVSIAG